MKAGMIFLYGLGSDRPVAGHQYKDRAQRKNIIKQWMALYAAAYNDCYLQIVPQTNIQRINRKGENTNK